MNISKLEGEIIAEIYIWASSKYDLYHVSYLPIKNEWGFYGILSHEGSTRCPFTRTERSNSLYGLLEKLTGVPVEIDL